MALDGSGDALREAMKRLEGEPPPTPAWFGRDSSGRIDDGYEEAELVSPRTMIAPTPITAGMQRMRLSSYDGQDNKRAEMDKQKGKENARTGSKPSSLILQSSLKESNTDSEEDVSSPASTGSVIIRGGDDGHDDGKGVSERRRSSYFGSKAQ